MSLWFQPPQGNFPPGDSRSIGFGQVPNRKAFLSDDQQQGNQSNTGGGQSIDLSNNFTFGSPKTEISFDPTVNYAQFSFANSQDVTFNTLSQQTTVFQSLNQIINMINYNYETAMLCEDLNPGQRCDLCDKLVACTSSSSGLTEKQVMVDLSLTEDGLCYHTASVRYKTATGRIYSWIQDAEPTCIDTTSCP
jgi:hypothetical protein